MAKGPFLTGEDFKSAFNLFCCIYGIGKKMSTRTLVDAGGL
jgi:hypothetical protein